MAITVIFKLKEPQAGVLPGSQKETPVNLFFNYGYYSISKEGKKTYTPLKYATGEKIKPCFWSDRPKYRAKQVKDFDYHNFNTRLDNIERAIKTIYRAELNDRRLPDPDQLRNLLSIELKRPSHYIKPEKETLNEFIDRFYNEIKDGKRLTQGSIKHRYAAGTIKNYKSFKNQFSEYQKENSKIDFDDIGKSFYKSFTAHFTERQQSPNNIGKYVKCLKVIMRAARAEDPPLHFNNAVEDKGFIVQREKTFHIYLTKNEVNALTKIDLSGKPHLELARDVFLVGIHTAQRYSDYSRIKKDHFRTLQSGTRVIELTQIKTRERVIIPIMPELDAILKKYDYTLPKTYDQKVNKYVKIIAADAGITEIITINKTRGGKQISEPVAKNKLISTHTARRTGITNMYLAGIPLMEIAKISGHKSESELLNYLKLGKEETADLLANHSYFK